MDLMEYIEEFVADGFKREIDQEENGARSLPFFATSLAVLVAIIGAVHSSLPPLSWAVYAAATWALLGALGVFVLVAIGYLWRAVRKRDFICPMPETGLREWAEALRGYYGATGSTDPDRDTLKDVRAALINQQAKAAANNRTVNARRVVARVHALTCLIVALALAFALIGTMLIHDGTDGASHDGNASYTAASAGGLGTHRRR
jgi:O-antigen/teichoic acid export membrane protein